MPLEWVSHHPRLNRELHLALQFLVGNRGDRSNDCISEGLLCQRISAIEPWRNLAEYGLWPIPNTRTALLLDGRGIVSVHQDCSTSDPLNGGNISLILTFWTNAH